MQDFFYEHCSLFTAQSLQCALERSGFACERVEHIFGGQYLWAVGQASNTQKDAQISDQGLGSLAGARERFQSHWRATLETARREGPIAIWGAGAKGVTFALLVDPDGVLIDHAIDVNPQKQGWHLAGTGLQVLAPGQSSQRHPRTIVIMNPNYRTEIERQAAAIGIAARFAVLDEESAQ